MAAAANILAGLQGQPEIISVNCDSFVKWTKLKWKQWLSRTSRRISLGANELRPVCLPHYPGEAWGQKVKVALT